MTKVNILAGQSEFGYCTKARPSPAMPANVRMLQFREFSEEVAATLLATKVSQSSGPDSVDPLVMKKLAAVLSPSLMTLFSVLVSAGRSPKE